MCGYYSPQTGAECRMSYQTIANHCSTSRLTAIRNMASLVAAGYVSVEKRLRENSTEQDTNIYTVHLDVLEERAKLHRSRMTIEQAKAITRKYVNQLPGTAAEALDFGFGYKTIDPKTGEIVTENEIGVC